MEQLLVSKYSATVIGLLYRDFQPKIMDLVIFTVLSNFHVHCGLFSVISRVNSVFLFETQTCVFAAL